VRVWVLTGLTAVEIIGIVDTASDATFERSSDEARALRDMILRVNPHVVIMKSKAVFAEYRDVVRTAERIEGVVAAAPFVFLELDIARAGHARSSLP